MCMILSIILLLVALNSQIRSLISPTALRLHYEKWGYLLELVYHSTAVLSEWRLYQLLKLKELYGYDEEGRDEQYSSD
jgi:hypothetical protein